MVILLVVAIRVRSFLQPFEISGTSPRLGYHQFGIRVKYGYPYERPPLPRRAVTAAKYWFLTVLRVSQFLEDGDLLASLSACEKMPLRDESNGDHQGFDLGEGLVHQTLQWRAALSLAKFPENHSSSDAGEGWPGRGEMYRPETTSVRTSSERDDQWGVGIGRDKLGEVKRRIIGT